MDDKGEIQKALFNYIKQQLPVNLSLVHEVSELLELSYDSTYRRLRLEKALTLDEALILIKHFQCPLELLMKNELNLLTFQHFCVAPEQFDKHQWIDFIYARLKLICKAQKKQIIYAAKDPPIFQYFQFPEIASFKFYFWEKTLFHSKKLDGKTFSLDKMDPDVVEKCRKIAALSLQIPTVEIWNEDTFTILLRQIEYHWVSGYFDTKDDLLQLLNSIELWLYHNQKQAELGMKFLYGHEPHGLKNSYTLYENEIVLNDNSIFISEDNKSSAHITYNVLGLLASSNDNFCHNVASLHQTLISKSNLISQVAEKERNRFFNKLHAKVKQFKELHELSKFDG
ncbi:hypothetical protein [Carboxylicivirga sp. M1479]|uniref:hypothetical protein n=1 Tax=Carboxylicivirga sp. M1479 TaxID=2594476 RepID=UPI0011788210|nr:hypothetical protein [Carboxylicivirga sp. M1479]TRX72069.1 hypothetical protein FNN09_03430 [Carboxylicivirga sp. M1479]